MAKYELSASLICCNPLNLEREIQEIEKANFQSIHFDVMDGIFVPRYGLYPEILSNLKNITKIPINVHLMVVNPEQYVELFKEAHTIYVHIEGNHNIHRTINLIKKAGIKAGVVLNIATPLSALDYILSEIDYVMLMAINPGMVGQKLIPQTYEKILQLKAKLKDSSIKIMIDGGVSFESATKMINCGADILVCGTSSIFRSSEKTVAENMDNFRKVIENRGIE